MSTLLTSAISTVLLAASGALVPATTPSQSNNSGDQLQQEIFSGDEIGSLTGRVSIPITIDRSNNRSDEISSVRLYFSPIEISEDDAFVTIEKDGKKRFKATQSSRSVSTVDLPAGTYVLSEIKYSTFNGGTSGIGPGSSGGAGRTFSYCLDQETLVFKVKSGHDAGFGILLANLPENTARHRTLNPVVGYDALISDQDANADRKPLSLVSFEDEIGTCSRGHYSVPATILPTKG